MNTDSRIIYWIGGSPCSGKSTIAELLTTKYDLIYYKCDEVYQNHIERCKANIHPTMNKIKGLSVNDIFSRPLEQQINDTIMFYKEEFGMFLEDIAKIDSSKPLLIEGAALLPEVVFQHLRNFNHGIWLIPTADFQIEQYSKRDWIHSILDECQDPNQSFVNWMNRDIQFAGFIKNEVQSRGLKLIEVGGGTSIEDNLAIVEAFFKLYKKI
jgi:uridine kinase